MNKSMAATPPPKTPTKAAVAAKGIDVTCDDPFKSNKLIFRQCKYNISNYIARYQEALKYQHLLSITDTKTTYSKSSSVSSEKSVEGTIDVCKGNNFQMTWPKWSSRLALVSDDAQ